MFLGCFTNSGENYDTLNAGLTQSQVASINPSKTWLTRNNSYLFQSATGMTIEKCINICTQFKFTYAGLENG